MSGLIKAWSRFVHPLRLKLGRGSLPSHSDSVNRFPKIHSGSYNRFLKISPLFNGRGFASVPGESMKRRSGLIRAWSRFPKNHSDSFNRFPKISPLFNGNRGFASFPSKSMKGRSVLFRGSSILIHPMIVSLPMISSLLNGNREFASFPGKSLKVLMASNIYLMDEYGNVKAIVISFFVVTDFQDESHDELPILLEKKDSFPSQGIDLSLKSLVILWVFSVLNGLGSRIHLVGKCYGPLATWFDKLISKITFVEIETKVYGPYDGAERIAKIFGRVILYGLGAAGGYLCMANYGKTFYGILGLEEPISVAKFDALESRLLLLESSKIEEFFTVDQVILLHQFALSYLAVPSF
ncbi:uncharacterized protein LOC110230521 isoform X1 [Arabidopsis lyrata subsp. lyrata]|uniref:uncharacterized protein LOC110230521 isoform X1 n=1 Tax=Arabidopsis lyrata subsp. lyrata TaxID=81972 RepID=UPI000A29D7C0|nr:uncharacterized protein LOC110230521 isoform X1 [Arabidopsis lyrata subsp. lyrata]|eukprot:XP_020889454.1 uncharacterized protein LOC110230521 isoform X1 [Arabidopsis lyrata subsp. lyrata]